MNSYFGNFIYLASHQEKADGLPTRVHALSHPTTFSFDDDEELLLTLDF